MRKKERPDNIVALPSGGPFFTRDKSFYKTFLPLLLMISLQQLAALTVNLADNIMLGRYTELALSGATLVNQLQFVLQSVAGGIGAGITVLGSQYWGKKETDPIRRVTGIGMKFALAIGLIFFLASKLAPAAVLGIFTNDQEVIAEGMKYLRIICWTYLIFGVSNSLMYSLQSVETASVGTIMSCSTIVINICLNYCFIYGNFGCPEMGIAGAAVATLTSRTVELIIILVYVLFIDKKLKMKVVDLLRFDVTYLKDFTRASLPVMVSGLMWGIAQGAQTAILGHMAAAVIAANSIAVTVYQLFSTVGMAAGAAASVTMGKTVGEERFDMIKPYTRTLQLLFLCFGIVCGALLFAFRNLIVGFYNISDEARTYALQFITVLSITTVGSCYEYPCEGGIIAGGGNPKYQAIVDNLFMWLFTIPVSALVAFVFNAPPLVVFCFLKADQFGKCIPNAIVTNRYRWVRRLTR